MKLDASFPQPPPVAIPNRPPLRQRGLNSARGRAAETASAGQLNSDGPADLVEPMLGLKLDKLQVQASTQVLKTYDEMIGSLFDAKV